MNVECLSTEGVDGKTDARSSSQGSGDRGLPELQDSGDEQSNGDDLDRKMTLIFENEVTRLLTTQDYKNSSGGAQ